MTENYSNTPQSDRRFDGSEGNRGGFRGGRSPGKRDNGGFRIRLSENEMRSARALQEAFRLKSVVAVLGFAIRTLAQMLEEGKLEELVRNSQSQPSFGSEAKSNRKLSGNSSTLNSQISKNVNPFARPEKPNAKSKQDEQIEDSSVKTETDSIKESEVDHSLMDNKINDNDLENNIETTEI